MSQAQEKRLQREAAFSLASDASRNPHICIDVDRLAIIEKHACRTTGLDDLCNGLLDESARRDRVAVLVGSDDLDTIGAFIDRHAVVVLAIPVDHMAITGIGELAMPDNIALCVRNHIDSLLRGIIEGDGEARASIL